MSCYFKLNTQHNIGDKVYIIQKCNEFNYASLWKIIPNNNYKNTDVPYNNPDDRLCEQYIDDVIYSVKENQILYNIDGNFYNDDLVYSSYSGAYKCIIRKNIKILQDLLKNVNINSDIKNINIAEYLENELEYWYGLCN